MSTCKLTIVLDQPDLVYQPGDTITGYVEVHTSKAVVCRAFTLDFGWRTQSKSAYNAEERVAQHSLFEGSWQPEQRFTYPFSLDVPTGPFTYPGKHFEVQWLLSAEAQLQQARNAKTEAVITLAPGPSEDAVNHGPGHPLNTTQENAKSARFLLLFGIAGIVSSLALVYALAFRIQAHTWELVLGWLAVAGIGLFSLVTTYQAVRSRLAERMLGAVSVALTPTTACPGDPISCTLRFAPRRDVYIDDVQIRLVGKEALHPDYEDDHYDPTHTLHEERLSFCKGQRLQAGREWQQTAQFVVPDQAPITFNARSHSVTWTLQVQIHIPQWPDWTYSQQVTVVPQSMPTTNLVLL